MKFYRNSLSPILTFAAGICLLVSCQNATDSNSPASGPMKAYATFNPTSVSRFPDSANWTSKLDAGGGGLYCDGIRTCTDTLSLKDALGSDTATIRLWTLGIRLVTLRYTQIQRTPNLAYLSIESDSLDLRLLDSFYKLRLANGDSLGKAGSLKSDLVAFYASLVLAHDPGCGGFPRTCPVGMSVDSVRTFVVYWAGKSGITSMQLAALNLGLDTTAIHLIVSKLTQANRLSSADSLALFPPYPVRVVLSVSVADLTAGGGSVGVNGSFSWADGRHFSSLQTIVRTTSGVVDTNVVPNFQKVPSANDMSLILTNNLTLQARPSAIVGTDTLVVTLNCDSGYSATSRVVFSVLAQPPSKPKLVRIFPIYQTGNALTFEADSLLVSWRVLNWRDVDPDSVFINSSKAMRNSDSTWGQNVYILPTSQPTIVTFRVLGKNDTSASDYVQVTRAKDTTGPSIQWISPSLSVRVDATVSKALVQVKVTDPSGVDSVSIQGNWASHDSGSYWSSSVGLGQPNGLPLKIVVMAWDKNRNQSLDSSISIARNVPSGTDKPALTLLQPASNVGNKLAFENTILHVVYKITDVVALDTASIFFNNTVPSRLTDSTWAADVPVPPTGSPSTIVVQAANVRGSGSSDQLVVTRSRDTVIPSIRRASGVSSHTVVFDTTSTTVSWTVSDNYKVGTIAINGTPVAVAAVVTKTMPLAGGINSFVLVVTDTFGNSAKDSVAIVRSPDAIPPGIVRSDVPNSPIQYSRTVTVSYTVTDNDSLATVTINKRIPTRNGNLYSLIDSLNPGDNSIVVVAKDRTGNQSVDSINLQTVLQDRDGNFLRFGRMPDGKAWTLQNIWTSPSSKSLDTNINGGSSTCFMDSCLNYGKSYSWAMAMDLPASCDSSSCPLADSLQHQGICPTGWHIPSSSDWTSLVQAGAGPGGSLKQGVTRLKSTVQKMPWQSITTTCVNDPCTITVSDYSGTDDFGFTLLPLQSSNNGYGGGSIQNHFAEYFTPTAVSVVKFDYQMSITQTSDNLPIRCRENN